MSIEVTPRAAAAGRFLRSEDPVVKNALSRVEFRLDSFRVDYEGYQEIGMKLLSGGVTVETASVRGHSRVAAVYTAPLDKISVSANFDISQFRYQEQLVHEATHALMDYHQYRMSNAVEEAIAYIAATIYALGKARRLRSPNDQRADAIVNAAFNVVSERSMIVTTGQRLLSRDADVAALINAVAAHTGAYPNARDASVNDGIPNGLRNPWYEPRGRP